MNIVELKNVAREEGQIFYFRKYTADAVLELPTETTTTPIYFDIETGPFGDRKITVKIIEAPNYPVIPLLSALKKHILDTDLKGLLP